MLPQVSLQYCLCLFLIVTSLFCNISPSLQWQQRAGGLCRFQLHVCGWMRDRELVTQNNWLFTQHIRQDFDSNTYNYDVTVHVFIQFYITNCRERQGCIQGFNLLHYMTNSEQLPSTEGSGYMNPENYQEFGRPHAPSIITTYTQIHNFTLPQSFTGFYIAAQDTGSCVTLLRMRVYRENCKARQIGLVLYPDVPAPVSGLATVDISCVENAEVIGSSTFICQSDGTWSSGNNPVCECRPGFMNRVTEGSKRECVGKDKLAIIAQNNILYYFRVSSWPVPCC